MNRQTWMLLAGSLLPAACGTTESTAPSNVEPAIRVQAEATEQRPFVATLRVSGAVRGHSTATLTSRSVGYVRAVLVRPGDLVREGQAVVELEARDVAAGVAQAQAALRSAQANRIDGESALQVANVRAALAKTNYERASNLHRQGVIAQAEFDQAAADLRAATAEEARAGARLAATQSETARAEAALGQSRALLDYSKIVAPFAGRVLDRLVDPGALASPGTPLVVVADVEKLRIEAAIPESRSAGLALGAEVGVEVDGFAGPLKGFVGEIVPNVDVVSRAFLIRVDLAGAAPEVATTLRAGSFARVTLPVRTESKLAVPSSAVSRFGALERVFVVERERAVLRLVTTGESQAGFTPVLSGLSEGDLVVRDPPANLHDESRVEVGS